MAKCDAAVLKMFGEEVLDRTRALPPQISAHVRTLLAEAKLRPGDQLPSTRELAAVWGTHVPVVHEGLTALVQDGWLVRRSRSGTYVRDRPPKLKTIGLYYYGDALSAPESRYNRALHHCLLDRIESRKLRWAMWTDPRLAEESARPWAYLEDACRQSEIDALIVPVIDRPHLGWLTKLPVPQAYVTSGQLPNEVRYDPRQMSVLAVAELARQGCRSVGLISILPRPGRRSEAANPLSFGAFQGFMAEAQAQGLQTRDAWTITHENRSMLSSSAHWGYEAFARLWAHPKHPDGLVVIYDAESVGVTTAILERGIRVPDQLRLAYHKTKEVELLCPFPVTYVGISVDELAEALLQLVERQFAGERVEPIAIESRILTARTRERRRVALS